MERYVAFQTKVDKFRKKGYDCRHKGIQVLRNIFPNIDNKGILDS